MKRKFYLWIKNNWKHLFISFFIGVLFFQLIMFYINLWILYIHLSTELDINAAFSAKRDFINGKLRFLKIKNSNLKEVISKNPYEFKNNIPVYYYYYIDPGWMENFFLIKNKELAEIYVEKYNEKMKNLLKNYRCYSLYSGRKKYFKLSNGKKEKKKVKVNSAGGRE